MIETETVMGWISNNIVLEVRLLVIGTCTIIEAIETTNMGIITIILTMQNIDDENCSCKIFFP